MLRLLDFGQAFLQVLSLGSSDLGERSDSTPSRRPHGWKLDDHFPLQGRGKRGEKEVKRVGRVGLCRNYSLLPILSRSLLIGTFIVSLSLLIPIVVNLESCL